MLTAHSDRAAASSFIYPAISNLQNVLFRDFDYLSLTFTLAP